MEISEEELEKIVEKKVWEKEEQNEQRIVELYQLAMKHREFLLRLSLLDDDERVKPSQDVFGFFDVECITLRQE